MKNRNVGIPPTDVSQLLGQIEVETKQAARIRVTGCLLSPAAQATGDAAEAAPNKITLIHHPAAVRLFDIQADRIRHYAALCRDGSAAARTFSIPLRTFSSYCLL